MPEKKLTQLRRAERGDKILTLLSGEGFRRKDIAKSLRMKPERVSAIRAKVKRGTVTAKEIERLSTAQKRLETKYKAELPARKAKQEAKKLGINYTDVSATLKIDPKDASKLLNKVKRGEAEPSDLRKIKKAIDDFKTKNVYTLHDTVAGDMAVFPSKTQARDIGKAKVIVKEFSDVNMAFEWWKRIGLGARYFVCVSNEAKGEFQIWDTRTASQRNRKR